MPVEIAPGLEVETVGDILGDKPQVIVPFVPETLEGTPELPPPGIYFDMPDSVYFALPAFSQSGAKKLGGSSMLFWAGCAWLNPRAKAKVKEHNTVGHAYHCRILEGKEEFERRFVMQINREDYPESIDNSDEIKDYISKLTFTDAAGKVLNHKPVTTVEESDGNGGVRKRKSKKEDWITQLLELEPDAPLWSKIQAKYVEEHKGKEFIWPELLEELEIAAAMIERDPGISPLARGGQAEVVLIWYCPKTGCPMKAKVDKMKVRRMIDLKSLVNQRERAIETAIRYEISGYKYNLQPSIYIEGGQEVRKLVREHGVDAIHVWPDEDGVIDPVREEEVRTFAFKWAAHVMPDEWTWIFQQKGDAAITRAVHYPTGGTVKMVTDDIMSVLKRRFIECSKAFGVLPWLDIAEPYTIADEDIPIQATEF